jgi:hypothetical protein
LVSILRWTGFLNKKPLFISNPALHNLRKNYPLLKIKPDLSGALCTNSLLLEKIRIVNPQTIDVHLAFIPRVLKSETDLRYARFEYMKDPNEIVWKINVEYKWNATFKKKVTRHMLLSLLDVLNLIAEDVLKVNKQVVMTLHS